MSASSPLETRVRERLAALRFASLERTPRAPSGIDLSSNDYLGLARHPLLVQRFIDGVQREGCGSTGSRLLRGEREAFERLEGRFARFKQAERALFFSSGYLANLGVLSALVEPGDLVFSDQSNHASLIDGLRLSKAQTVIFPHNDVQALRESMARARVESGTRATFLIVESLFSMDGDMAPLADYAALCRDSQATLIVDEAHAVGVYGARGSGLIEEAGLDHAACLSINTAGKALGVAGAWVAGPAWALEYVVQRARSFVFSTAPPPALASALEASLDVVDAEPHRRHQVANLAAFLRRLLVAYGVPCGASRSQILPIPIGDNDRALAVARALQVQGFDVRAIRPPSVPVGTARLRLSVNAALSEDLLEQFARSLAGVLQEAGVCSAVSS